MPEFQIYNMEVNLKTGEMLTEPKMIWAGWDKRYTEGPHIYKKDGYYYLLCAEGGTFTTHMISMARSRSLWEPFETYEKNPVWTAHGTNNFIQHTGHADLFQDKNGEWWIVMLGVRKDKSRFIMGRESFISKVEWPTEGWPIVTPIDTAVKGLGVSTRKVGPPITAREGVDWLYLRDPILNNYSISGNNLELRSTPVDLSAPNEPVTFIGKRQRVLEGSSSVTLSTRNSTTSTALQAGLAVYKDEHRYIIIGYDFAAKEVYLEAVNRAKRIRISERRSFIPQATIVFKIAYSSTAYNPYFGETPEAIGSSQTLTPLGKVDTADLTGFDFVVSRTIEP
jgi:beta-xylosidase